MYLLCHQETETNVFVGYCATYNTMNAENINRGMMVFGFVRDSGSDKELQKNRILVVLIFVYILLSINTMKRRRYMDVNA